MNIIKALESLRTTGGFSYNIETGELNPAKGYMVAVSKKHEKIVSNITRYKAEAIEAEIKDYILSNADKLADKNIFLGAWIDKGKLYLDVSERVGSKGKAIELCRIRQQLAYFDNAAKQSIFVKDENKQAKTASNTSTGGLLGGIGFSMNLNKKPKTFS